MDGVLDLPLAFPKELGGSGGHATNPEQLFAAGYAACFENALMRVARERKAPLAQGSSYVTAHVGIGREADGYFRLSVKIEVSVAGRERSEIEELARIAHEEVCPVLAGHPRQHRRAGERERARTEQRIVEPQLGARAGRDVRSG